MKTTSLRKTKAFKLDSSGEIRDTLLSHWGNGDATCVGHARDGVIWGKVYQNQLNIPYDSNPKRGARLRWETLQDLRIFNEERELRLWRTGDGFEAIIITETHRSLPDHDCESLEVYFRTQAYELIRQPGNEPPDDDFVELRGLAGQLHFPPGPAPSQIRVRLYYQVDENTGLIRCIENRLLALVPWRE